MIGMGRHHFRTEPFGPMRKHYRSGDTAPDFGSMNAVIWEAACSAARQVHPDVKTKSNPAKIKRGERLLGRMVARATKSGFWQRSYGVTRNEMGGAIAPPLAISYCLCQAARAGCARSRLFHIIKAVVTFCAVSFFTKSKADTLNLASNHLLNSSSPA